MSGLLIGPIKGGKLERSRWLLKHAERRGSLVVMSADHARRLGIDPKSPPTHVAII